MPTFSRDRFPESSILHMQLFGWYLSSAPMSNAFRISRFISKWYRTLLLYYCVLLSTHMRKERCSTRLQSGKAMYFVFFLARPKLHRRLSGSHIRSAHSENSRTRSIGTSNHPANKKCRVSPRAGCFWCAVRDTLSVSPMLPLIYSLQPVFASRDVKTTRRKGRAD